MTGHTIMAAPFEAGAGFTPLVNNLDELDRPHGVVPYGSACRHFRIRAAHSDAYRRSAGNLINRMYSWRGYRDVGLGEDATGQRMTLVACEGDVTLGTLSVGFDAPSHGLMVELSFAEEVGALRQAGYLLCEFTKLAVDGAVRSKRVLASLFHVAYIQAHCIQRAEKLLIEVNPRHVRFYEKMLGFRVLAGERMNPRVNAPAVLLCLDLAHARHEIARLGGQPELADTERSLYPYFLSPVEQAHIVERLRGVMRRPELPALVPQARSAPAALLS